MKDDVSLTVSVIPCSAVIYKFRGIVYRNFSAVRFNYNRKGYVQKLLNISIEGSTLSERCDVQKNHFLKNYNFLIFKVC